MDLIHTHHYMLANLLGLPAMVAAFAIMRPLRPTMLIAGGLESLHAPPLVFFNDVYWSPHRLGGWSWGIEDVVVSFSLGFLVWAAAAWPLRDRLRLNLTATLFVRRIAVIAAATTGGAVAVWSLGAGTMATLVIVMALTACALFALRPELWRLSLSAVLVYPPYYCLVLYVAGAIGFDFFALWDGPELWGPRLFGLPVDEIAFVTAFSVCYPLIIGFAADARVAARGAASSGALMS